MINPINDKLTSKLVEEKDKQSEKSSKVEQLANEMDKFSFFNSQVVIFGEIGKLI